MQITQLKPYNIGRQFVFAPIDNGGLGILQPSTLIQVESIYGLYKSINVKRDNFDYLITKVIRHPNCKRYLQTSGRVTS